ncbi:tetratricopeptide repeat protein [Rubrivirga sp.]|uniref:tetratricopeptide repeat protein n=1 Tax=Rubrivirga sp. TaxID=1885344 RepID=UPI003C792B0C
MRSRLLTVSLSLVVALLVGGADGCSSDPNVEGAKLDLNNRDYDRALENLDTALETDPQNVEALLLRVEVLRQQYENTPGAQPKQAFLDANFADMVATVGRAEAAAPEDPDVDNAALSVWALAVNAGNDIVRTPDADALAAVPYFEQSTVLMPDSTQGYLGLGLAYLRAGDASLAVAPLERGIAVNDNDPLLAYYYGRSLVLAERSSEAVTFLEGAQAQFPGDEDIQTMLLNAYTQSGRTEDAVERYAEAAERDPSNPTIAYNYGALLLQVERYDEAIGQLTRATELAPDNSDAFYNLGAAFQNRAASFNEEANETEDTDAANALIGQRDENLEASLPPLMQARTLAAGTESEAGVCDALFRVYTQLGRVDDAEGVSECAGFSMD